MNYHVQQHNKGQISLQNMCTTGLRYIHTLLLNARLQQNNTVPQCVPSAAPDTYVETLKTHYFHKLEGFQNLNGKNVEQWCIRNLLKLHATFSLFRIEYLKSLHHHENSTQLHVYNNIIITAGADEFIQYTDLV